MAAFPIPSSSSLRCCPTPLIAFQFPHLNPIPSSPSCLRLQLLLLCTAPFKPRISGSPKLRRRLNGFFAFALPHRSDFRLAVEEAKEDVGRLDSLDWSSDIERVPPSCPSANDEAKCTGLDEVASSGEDHERDRFSRETVTARLVKGTAYPDEGRLLHVHFVEVGVEGGTFEWNLLVRMYGRHEVRDDAISIYDSMDQCDLLSWNTVIALCTHQEYYKEVLQIVQNMQQGGYEPSKIAIVIVLRPCASLEALDDGKAVNAFIVDNRSESETTVSRALVQMYGRCGHMDEAYLIFHTMPDHNAFTWTSMISACSRRGQDKDVLEFYRRMLQEGLKPNKLILITVLKACGNLADCEEGQKIHNSVVRSAFESDVELSTAIVSMYGNCGAPEYAYSVFERINPRSVATYNAMIAAVTSQKHGKKALEIFERMLQDSLKPDVFTYISVLEVCANIPSLKEGKVIHLCIVEDGLDSNVIMGTALLNMYGKCGAIAEACFIFGQISRPNVITWNAMIAACAGHGHCQKSIQLFKQMLQEGLKPSSATFASVLPACGHLAALDEGKMIHAFIVDCSLESVSIVGSSLVIMYGKCGALADARSVFDKMHNGNVIFWTGMISVYVQQGHAKDALQLFRQMQQEKLKPNKVTFITVLSACVSLKALVDGQWIHACIVECGCEFDLTVRNSLVHMYGKCGALTDARQVFDNISQRSQISWNTMMTAYIQAEHSECALDLFQQILQEGMKPDVITCVNVLSACASLAALAEGKSIHLYILYSSFERNVIVATALINMYGKSGALNDAQSVFDNMPKHNVVSWTAIITAYSQQGCGVEAIKLFEKMMLGGIKPNKITLISILGAYASLARIADAEVIHACIWCHFESNIELGNALINMYGKCGEVEDAKSIFNKMLQRNVVSWNAMITAYAQHGHGKKALHLFQTIHQDNILPDEMMLSNCLSVCASLGALGSGKLLHESIVISGFDFKTGVGNGLITMYSKCGALKEAHAVFNAMQRDVVSWNAIIAAYAQQGCADEAIQLFKIMQQKVKADEVTFLSVLSACSHAGLINEGHQIFLSMSKDCRIAPTMGHYVCMIDLFGRAGRLDVAENFIYKMPFETTSVVWMTFLGACRIHGDSDRGKRALEYLSDIDPQNAAPCVLLSNIFAEKGRQGDVENLNRRIARRRLQKKPGCSTIEVNNEVYSFLPRDRSHPETEAIYRNLETLNRQMKEMGYVPDTRLVVHDATKEQKEFILVHHSEKLAMSFGLISTPSRTPLLIIKNLRMCFDCHTAFKFCSIIANREITLRDTNRLHHFKHGMCSCGDYW